MALDRDTLAQLLDTVERFGGRGRLTSKGHDSGTDRIAEIAEGLTADLIVNVQADEPLIAPLAIDDAIEAFKRDPTLEMSTLRRRIYSQADLHNPNIVKVVCDADGHALYFSRAPIPYTRDGCPPPPQWKIGLFGSSCGVRLPSAWYFARNLTSRPAQKASPAPVTMPT